MGLIEQELEERKFRLAQQKLDTLRLEQKKGVGNLYEIQISTINQALARPDVQNILNTAKVLTDK